MGRRALSLLLVFSLMLSMCGTAFATGASEETNEINYVSLGDSMTNGYGLPGYDYDSGVEDYGTGSYANQFAEWLGAEHAQLAMSAMRAEDLHWLLELDYTDADAIALTEDDAFNEEGWNAKFTTGDYWTWNEICTHSRTKSTTDAIKAVVDEGFYPETYKGGYDGDVALIAKYYQESVANADVISVGIGTGNFGVFMLGRIMEAVSFGGSPDKAMVYQVENAIRECSPELQAQILDLKAQLYAELENYVSIEGNAMMEALVNTVVYGCLSYVLNYAGSIDAIVELNPDAEIIIVGLMNTMNGLKFEADGQVLDLGAYMGGVMTTLNAYLAAYPTAMQALGNFSDATFYYAEESTVECFADTYGDEIKSADGVVRQRFVESIVGNNGDGMVWSLMDGVVSSMFNGVSLKQIGLADIEVYEGLEDAGKAAAAAQDTSWAVSCALYLAFEDAIIECIENGGTINMNSLLGLGSLDISLFAGVMESFKARIGTDGAEYIEVAATVVAAGFDGALTADAVKDLIVGGDDAVEATAVVLAKQTVFGSLEDTDKALIDRHHEGSFDVMLADHASVDGSGHSGGEICKYSIIPKYEDGVTEAKSLLNTAVGSTNMLCMLLALPTTLSNSLVNDPTVSGLLNLYGRFMLGNGLSSHPSANGHVALFEAVKTAYAEEYTAADKTEDNLKVALDMVVEYYDEAYAYAYDYAEAEGYITLAVASIDAVIAELNAIDLSGTQMTDAFKAEVYGEIAEIVETLGAAKDLVLEADVLDQASLDALIALLNEAADDITNLKNLLVQAGIDTTELVVIPALEAAHAKLVDEVVPAIIEKLTEAVEAGTEWLMAKAQEAYDAIVEALVEAVKEYAPEIADAVYDYLYNNPTEVIAFLKECGPYLADIAEEYGDEAMMVIGGILYYYGEDVAAYIVENAEEIMEDMIAWIDEHGENAWALICVYLEELGVFDAVEKNAQEILEELEQILDQVDAEMAEQIKNVLDQIVDVAEDVLAKVESAKSSIEEQLADLYDQLTALNKELAEKKAELENAIGEAKAELEKAIAELEKLIAETEAAIAVLEEKLAAMAEDIENLYDAILGLNDAVELMLAEGLNAGMAAIQTALTNVADAVADLAAHISDEAAAEVAEAIEEIKALLNDAYVDAITDNYVITEDSYYVALGDASAYETSAKLLTQALGLCDNKAILTEDGMTAADLLANIESYAGDLAKADLVTLGFSANAFTEFARAQLNLVMDDGEAMEMDWVAVIGEDGAAFVAEKLDEMYESFVEAGLGYNGMMGDMAAMMTLIIESYAFSYTSHMLAYAQVIEAIHAINPDAQVVLIGMYNPMDGVLVQVGDTEEDVIDVGNYLRYLVDAANAYALGYAMIVPETIYVDAPDVETSSVAGTYVALQFVWSLVKVGTEAYEPTEAGYEYIKDQILNALNPSFVATGLMGDADNNGEVDFRDAMLIHQYYLELITADDLNICCCDVDGSGEIDFRDAILVHQYYLEIITEF